MSDKRRTLYLDLTGRVYSMDIFEGWDDMMRTQVMLAFLATGRAGQLIKMIDDADKAGVESARDVADAIRLAAKNAGLR